MNESSILFDTLVIGFGSRLRGDDAFGPEVVERFAHRLAAGEPRPDVRVETCQGLTPDLALPVSQSRCAIFVDCSAAGPVGRLEERRIVPRIDMEMSMVHFLDPQALLAWSATLYGRVPETHVLSTGGVSFAVGESLSSRVVPVVDEAVEVIGRLIGTERLSHA